MVFLLRLVCLFASCVKLKVNSDSIHFLNSLSNALFIKDYYVVSET